MILSGQSPFRTVNLGINIIERCYNRLLNYLDKSFIGISVSLVDNRPFASAHFLMANWCLRLTIAFQCVGISGRYLFASFETESPIFGLLYFEFGFQEITSQIIDDFGVYSCLIAGGALLASGLFRILSGCSLGDKILKRLFAIDAAALFLVFIWTLSMAIGQTIRGDIFARFTLLEDAVRMAAPLALLALMLTNRLSDGGLFPKCATTILIFATSMTFALHGYKATELYGPFVDFLLLSKPLGITMVSNQEAAEALLFVIGWIDIVLAISIVLLRWQGIALYMAVWGLLTAYSRIAAGGMDAWPELFIRAANAGAPLTLFFLFRSKLLFKNKCTT